MQDFPAAGKLLLKLTVTESTDCNFNSTQGKYDLFTELCKNTAGTATVLLLSCGVFTTENCCLYNHHHHVQGGLGLIPVPLYNK